MKIQISILVSLFLLSCSSAPCQQNVAGRAQSREKPSAETEPESAPAATASGGYSSSNANSARQQSANSLIPEVLQNGLRQRSALARYVAGGAGTVSGCAGACAGHL